LKGATSGSARLQPYQARCDKLAKHHGKGRHSRRSHPWQQGPECPPTRPERTSRNARPACWWPPISRHAASTSIPSAHVVNFDIPNVPETYVHRIGRHGPLCRCLRDITKLIARQIPVVEDHPFPASGNASKPLPPEPPRGQGRQGGGRNSGGRSQGGRSGGNSGGSGQPKDFAALTAELINDLEGGGPKAKPASGASKTNSRRRWRGPRPGGGGGQR
jgi:uncharacterized membrane protein YgcG